MYTYKLIDNQTGKDITNKTFNEAGVILLQLKLISKHGDRKRFLRVREVYEHEGRFNA